MSAKSLGEERILRGEIGRCLLAAVAITGVVVTAAAFPGLLALVPRDLRRRYPKASFRRAYLRMDRKGLFAATETPRGLRIVLTKKGKQQWEAIEAGKKTIPRPRTWDGKWRLFVFDIVEKHRATRDQMRGWLRSLGFHRLQDSIWVHPYECADVAELLRTRFGVRVEALYIRAEHIDNDRWLRKHFGLTDGARDKKLRP